MLHITPTQMLPFDKQAKIMFKNRLARFLEDEAIRHDVSIKVNLYEFIDISIDKSITYGLKTERQICAFVTAMWQLQSHSQQIPDQARYILESRYYSAEGKARALLLLAENQ